MRFDQLCWIEVRSGQFQGITASVILKRCIVLLPVFQCFPQRKANLNAVNTPQSRQIAQVLSFGLFVGHQTDRIWYWLGSSRRRHDLA